jgi:Helicase conserved C-terminal domain
VGINLTQANHVFIMEPCFNPAVEAQAIGRVHRLGQKRDVEIVRLVMEKSVESRMVDMLKKKYGGANVQGGIADEFHNGDKKPAAKVDNAIMVGSIRTERVSMMEEEFDLLYGFEPATDVESDDGTAVFI